MANPSSPHHTHLRSHRSRHHDDLPAPYPDTIAALRAEILKELTGNEDKTTAISMALVDDERILWAEAFGSIDRPRGVAPTTETLFCAASCSKVVAAIAAMILVDRGTLELDAPLVRYMPDYRMADDAPWHDITVRMLLNHSSGLPGVHFPNVLTVMPVSGYAAQVRDMLATERLKHMPGEMAAYGSDGFMLIEPLVSAVTGQPYTGFVEREILEPLGMSHTRFTLSPSPPGSFAPTLDEAGSPEPQQYANIYSSGLFSTPSDLGRLSMMFMNGGRLGKRRILSEAAVTEMCKDQTVDLPFNPITDHHVHFGLGWDGVNQGGLAAVGVVGLHKAGDADHYHSYFIVAPDERLAAAVMVTNRLGFGSCAIPLAERILLHALAERGSIAHVPAPPEPAAPPAIPASVDELAAITGIYASSYGLQRLDVCADQTLTLSEFIADQWRPTLEGLRLRQDGRFVADGNPCKSYRGFVAAGRRYLAVRIPWGMGHYDMELPVGHELSPAPPLSARWQSRIGKRWLAANEPYSSFLALGRQPPLITLAQVRGLEGYLAVSLRMAGFDLMQTVDPRESDHVARMCLRIPIDNGWGLSDLVIEERDGEEWLIWYGTRYRPLETVPILEPGQGTVTIGPEVLGVWFRWPAASLLNLTGAWSWYLYDAGFCLKDWGMGEKTVVGAVNDGAYLLLYGAPNTAITLTAQP